MISTARIWILALSTSPHSQDLIRFILHVRPFCGFSPSGFHFHSLTSCQKSQNSPRIYAPTSIIALAGSLSLLDSPSSPKRMEFGFWGLSFTNGRCSIVRQGLHGFVDRTVRFFSCLDLPPAILPSVHEAPCLAGRIWHHDIAVICFV